MFDNQAFKIHGVRVVVHDVPLDACDQCEEKVIDGAEMKRAKEIATQLASDGKRATG